MEAFQILSLTVAIIILLENRLNVMVPLTALHGALLMIPLIITHGMTNSHTLVLLPMIILFKVILTPWILLRTARQNHVPESPEARLGFFPTFFLLVAAAWLCDRFGTALAEFSPVIPRVQMILALMGIAVGLSGFIVRKHWIPLLVGFMLFENATFAFTLILDEVVPWGVELGAFTDTILILIAAGTLQVWNRNTVDKKEEGLVL